MTTATSRTVRLAAAVAVCGLAIAAGQPVAASPAASGPVGTDAVPPVVEVPPGNTLVGDFLGRGVQVYLCTSGAWTFVEPAANLAGWTKQRGTAATAVHFRGPSWESTDDGSLVEARVIASSPVKGAVPELLLQSTNNRGDGVFGHVSFLQRLATRGGTAPLGPCADGQTVGVPYQADYRFFAPA
jgi:hypothetical protein